MKRWLGILALLMGVATPALALVGTSVSIFGFNYNVVLKSYNTDANGQPNGTCTWVLTGTGGGMDFLVVDGPQFP